MNHPAASYGYRRPVMRTTLISSPPNVFIGGPDPDSPGFPLKTCGNDGLRIDDLLDEQAAENKPTEIQFPQRSGFTSCPSPGLPIILPSSITVLPRTIVRTGTPFTFRP